MLGQAALDLLRSDTEVAVAWSDINYVHCNALQLLLASLCNNTRRALAKQYLMRHVPFWRSGSIFCCTSRNARRLHRHVWPYAPVSPKPCNAHKINHLQIPKSLLTKPPGRAKPVRHSTCSPQSRDILLDGPITDPGCPGQQRAVWVFGKCAATGGGHRRQDRRCDR